jgi:hypothetical protein
MLNLFKRPIIIRMEQGDYDRHIATIKGEAQVLADLRVEAAAKSFEETLDIAIKQRDEAQDEHAAAVDRELHATEQRDTYNDIATRALTLLSAVDTKRTGGKQLYDDREALFAAAMQAGLWGELPIKE